MDDDEYKRLLAAYNADKEKERQNSTQIQLNNYTPKYNYSSSSRYETDKDAEIRELRQKIYEYERNGKSTRKRSSSGDSKAGIGFVCAFFLGIIGLIIGLLIYKDDEDDKRSFLKGWGWTFGITIVLSIIIGVVVYLVTLNYINNAMDSIPYMINAL